MSLIHTPIVRCRACRAANDGHLCEDARFSNNPNRVTFTDYPFTGHWFDRGHGLRLHYLDEGRGDPVVMVHGNPSWSYYYRRLVLALRDSYRCIVPDHVGMGRSDKPDDGDYDYTLQSRIDDLAALLAHLGIRERVTLVVHDWGGMIGFGWALRNPAVVKRLVILNTAVFPLPAGKHLPLALKLGRDSRIGVALIRGLNAFALGAAWFGVARRLSKEERRALVAPYDSWANRIATLRFVQDIPLSPADRAWARVEEAGRRLGEFADRPVLIGWGLKDFVFDADFLARFRQSLPAAEVHAFADAGHYVLEDAYQRLIPRVRDFLARHP